MSGFFFILNLFYSVLFALLLVNLLIAMMNETYAATMAEAELDWRVSYASNLLRYEETWLALTSQLVGYGRVKSWVRVGTPTLDGEYFFEKRVYEGGSLFDSGGHAPE